MAVLFPQVVIVGPGLIGGSLGLALRRRAMAGRVRGVARTRQTLALAKRCGCIASGTTNLRQAVQHADLVVLAAPVQTIIAQLRQLGPILPAGCMVTDVGSTKKEIVRAAQEYLPKNIFFVGSHPLAGSEKTGPAQARHDLFEKSICFLTPTPWTSAASLRKIQALWRQVGATVVCLSPSAHDRVVAYTSHLPHLLAAALVRTLPADLLRFTGSGFRDMTRIAAGEEQLWRDIFLTNNHALRAALHTLQREIQRFQRALDKKRACTCKKLLSHARRRRAALEELPI